MITFKGKEYINPKEATLLYDKPPQSTLYFWANSGELETLDLDEFCKELPLEKENLNSKFYIEINSLEQKIKETRS